MTEHLKQQQGGNSGGGRGRGAKKAVARDLVDAHTVVFQAALDLELQQEWQEAEERLQVGSPRYDCTCTALLSTTTPGEQTVDIQSNSSCHVPCYTLEAACDYAIKQAYISQDVNRIEAASGFDTGKCPCCLQNASAHVAGVVLSAAAAAVLATISLDVRGCSPVWVGSST